jgi:hypothetical protein
MAITDPIGLVMGQVKVVTTDHAPTPPEHFAERIVDRLIFVGDSAPEPIKAQALAYREAMLDIVLRGIRAAIDSDRMYRK